MQLPEFSGPPISTRPPFQFSNVMVSCFPLRAQLDQLQRFVDGYLNIIPRELGYFRVALPYVNLMLLDYGKLSAQATNYGWFSQRELLFSVTLEWYRWVEGRWLFHDWASVSPFVCVDSEMSMTLGRTAMGWPKSLVKLTPSLSGWIQDPDGATVDLSVSAQVVKSAYAGVRMQEQPLLNVRSQTAASFRQPFDAESPLWPWTLWSNLARSASALGGDFMSSLHGLGLWPAHEGSSLENARRKAERALQMSGQAWPWAPSLCSQSVNLKQFRRADDPRRFCYQALTGGPLTITAFNRGGRLGSSFADPSGGYLIELGCWANFPFVDKLGLDAEIYTSASGPDVARLRPIFPLWYDCNMEYARTETIAWRTASERGLDGVTVDGRWRDGEGRTYADPQPGAPPYFNTTSGASSPVISGPFEFPSATLTVYPLLANHHSLQTLLDKTLNTPLAGSGQRFEVWGATPEDCAYLYVVVVDAGEVVSQTNNIGDWGDMSLTFYIPVVRFVRDPNGDDAVVGAGLFPAYTFASGTTQACTLSELYGVLTVESSFTRLPHSFGGEGEAQLRPLLRLAAQSLPALNEGQQAAVSTLLELAERGADGELIDAPLGRSAELFCRLLRRETARKNQLDEEHKRRGRTRALELLSGVPFVIYTLKQFRDAGTPERACYQALVQIPFAVREAKQLEEIERLVSLELYERASFPIAAALGVVARERRFVGGTIVHSLEAVRPFRLRAAMFLGNGREICSRADCRWVMHELPSAERQVRFSTRLEQHVSRHHYTHLKVAIADWLEQRGPESEPPVDDRLPNVDPQALLESILSREWEDRSPNSARAIVRQRVVRKLERAEAGWGSWLQDNLERLEVCTLADRTLVRWLHRLEYASLVFDREYERRRADVQAIEANTLAQAFAELSEPDWLHALADGAAFPLPALSRAQREQFAGLRSALERVTRTHRASALAEEPDALAHLSQVARALLRFLYPFAERRIEHAIDEAAERLRKPDHCVLRATAGSDSDRLFPLSQSWNSKWYHGKGEP